MSSKPTCDPARLVETVAKTQFVDYNDSAKSYDLLRDASVGSDFILGSFCSTDTDAPMHEKYIIDAGSGTGNYVTKIEKHVGRVHAMDLSQAMLDKAREKFTGNPRVFIEKEPTSLDCMPVETGTVDGIMCNQVIQHVESPETLENRENLKTIMKEFYRVLKPGGTVVISTRSKVPRYSDLYWYGELIPKACEKMEKKVPSRCAIIKAMEHAGFELKSSVSPHYAMIMQSKAYYDGNGPLQEGWRRGDSCFSLVDEEELESLKAKVQEKINNGTIDAYIKDRDSLRTSVGQCLFMSCTKPKDEIASL